MKKITIFVMIVSLFMMTFAFTSCGKNSEDSGNTDATVETLDPGEAAELEKKANELNKKPESFYGKWKATSPDAEYLYGYLEVTINEDGTIVIDVSEDHMEGTWEKIDGGISYSVDVMSGEFYYGKTCKMTIQEEGLEEDEFEVTLEKVE